MIFTTLRGKKARRLWILDADLPGHSTTSTTTSYSPISCCFLPGA